ncbi:MAG: hypothetical protein A3A58_03365 [Candidatus Blackburnbacteria bacterium RIFCSPLOWO2_01_FULL_41_27]|uniref:Uncharacterized protein n=2 Tax=Candidatus Blackburniibacteriota TaxID=1817898 RepID=A0A1G1V826_9BACT|nr:MAG: hypothetical protein A3F61_01805 [Candidatus Blackburnbacteria bacterium RIFCSPHIGHO2_12_FULL_41_13b]OGY13249.1 MAG: hypothetical protein A3A58_03365 [Candidatus Blackburnbacteria bacterium RIFCSPLOWO2_01_FULL_41_27]
MTPGGKEAILPKPLSLAPDIYTPDNDTPQVLASWADGSFLLAVKHSCGEYCEPASPRCQGLVVVPIVPKDTGNKTRFCDNCQEKVLVKGVGGLRIEAASVLQALRQNGRTPR